MCYVSKDGFTHLDGISWVLLNCVLCTLNGFEHIFRFITCKVPNKNVAAPFIIPVNHSLHPITGLKTPGCYAAHRLRTQRRVLPESRLSVLLPEQFQEHETTHVPPSMRQSASLVPPPPLLPGTMVTITRLGQPDPKFVLWIRDVIQRTRPLLPGNYQPAQSNGQGCTKPVPLVCILPHHEVQFYYPPSQGGVHFYLSGGFLLRV